MIRNLTQKDKHRFTLEWIDGKITDLRLSDVQRHCTCARCRDAGAKLVVDEDVEATRIVSVGGYALQIFFTRGCSKGIYPFELLRLIGERHETEQTL